MIKLNRTPSVILISAIRIFFIMDFIFVIGAIIYPSLFVASLWIPQRVFGEWVTPAGYMTISAFVIFFSVALSRNIYFLMRGISINRPSAKQFFASILVLITATAILIKKSTSVEIDFYHIDRISVFFHFVMLFAIANFLSVIFLGFILLIIDFIRR